MNKTEYLTALTEQIQNKSAKELVEEEISAHMEDQKAAYLLEGKEEAEAEALSVKQMGDPVETGRRLDKIHRPKTDWMLIGLAVALSLFGIVMQAIIFPQMDNKLIATTYTARTIRNSLIGISVMAGVYFLDYRIIGKYVWQIYIAYMISMAVLMKVIMTGGRWYRILLLGKVSMMLFIPVFAAFCYYYRGEKWKGIVKCVLLFFWNSMFHFFIGYYASASWIMAGMTCLAALILAQWKGIFGGNRKCQMAVTGAVTLGIPAVLLGDLFLFNGKHLMFADYQIMRLQAMLHPSAFANTVDYQTMQIRRQLAESSLLGGGNISPSAGEVLSGSYADFVLACTASYFGLLVMAAVIFAVLLFFLRALRVSVKQKNRLGFLLGVSCSIYLLCKTVFYIAMNLGIGPVVSIDMPFLSYGFHNTVLNYLFLGIILSVYRNTGLLGEWSRQKVFGVTFTKKVVVK